MHATRHRFGDERLLCEVMSQLSHLAHGLNGAFCSTGRKYLGEQVRHFSRHEEAVHDLQKGLVLHLRLGQYERHVFAFLPTLFVQNP